MNSLALIPLQPIWRRKDLHPLTAAICATSAFLSPSLVRSSLLLSFPAFKRGNISLQRRRISLTTSASARSLGSLLCSADNRQGGRDGRGGVPSIPSARAGRTDIRRRPRLERASALCAARDRGTEKNGMVWHERASWEREKFKAASWDQRPLLPASLSSSPLSLLGENLPSQCASGESESAF